MSVRVRFAPSPTGALHVGGARTALFNWLFARANQGVFILRIEDTDRNRYQESALQEILESLKWLNLNWDEGPGVSQNGEEYFQSKRTAIYQEHAKILLAKGAAYKCFCSAQRLEELRNQQQQKGIPQGYDRKCRGLSMEETEKLEKDQSFVVRLKIPLGGVTRFQDEIRGIIKYENKQLDDLVLLKGDGFPTYHLANVVDDHLMAITHVMRGDEWIASTPRHIILYEALGWTPPKFVHLPVILAPGGGKLSKRHGAASVMEYREKGYLPEALVNFLALLGWSPGDDRERMPIEETIQRFTLERINPKGAAFDEKKLEWLNGQYLSDQPAERLFEMVSSLWEKAGYLTNMERVTKREWLISIIHQLKIRNRKLTDFVDYAGYFFRHPEQYDENAVKKCWQDTGIVERMEQLRRLIEESRPFNTEVLENNFKSFSEKNNLGMAQMIHPTRLAVSGISFGPGLYDLLVLLGQETVLFRMNRAIEYLKTIK